MKFAPLIKGCGQKGSKLPDYYNASDIAVWPGLSSISIIEAASTGLPLIISNYPIETYSIEYRNGYSFEIGNEVQLRNLLAILIYNNNKRDEMGTKSRKLVEDKLNWSNIADLYVESYGFKK